LNKIRIIIGVCLGVALVHIGLTSQRGSPWVIGMVGAMFGWFAWDGVANGRAVLGPALIAERETHPIGFWLVIGLQSLMAILALSVPLWAQLH
jgi:hypothetical protein